MMRLLVSTCVIVATASAAHAFCPEPTSFDRSRYVDQLYEYVVCIGAEHAETLATLEERIAALEGRLAALETAGEREPAENAGPAVVN
jgi:hypothetical protein